MRTLDDMTEDERELYFAERRDARKRRGFSVDEDDPRIVDVARDLALVTNKSLAESADIIAKFTEVFNVVDLDGDSLEEGGE